MLITSPEFFPNEIVLSMKMANCFFLFLEIDYLKLDFGLSDTYEKDLIQFTLLARMYSLVQSPK